MKEYIRQFYNEGFATTFYLRPINYLKKKIKNEKIVKFISLIIKIIYTIIMILFAIYMFLDKYPL